MPASSRRRVGAAVSGEGEDAGLRARSELHVLVFRRAKARESDLANELRDAQAKVALLEARLAESQSQQAALETLYRELAPSRDELALTEVEQVLVLASQQLALAGNVQAALAAVQLADGKLARMDRPQLAPLRRSLDSATQSGETLDGPVPPFPPAASPEAP